jgi:23S rRNA (uracil1939-C5)-methyltransferase/tRNA (uracil-5-)-methyltransferase
MPRPPKKFHPHPFAYHEELELPIESLSNLGDGIGRVPVPATESPESSDADPALWVVFVPFCLPGERVRARIFRNDKNHSRADLLEVLEPSPDRTDPVCPLFGECGGCQYQHMDYQAQLDWKTRQVGELLRHMADIDHPVEPCHPSPRTTGYRSKLTPHFARPGRDGIGDIGFLPNGRRSGLVDVPQCPIAMDEINAALPGIRADTRRRAKEYKRGATLLLRVTEGRVETNPNAVVSERVGDLELDFLAGDFFQNNPFILPDFTAHVAAEAAGDGIRFLVDAYCGSGLFALSLARHFERVAGVEVSESSADWARRNAAANQIPHAEFLASPAEAIFRDIVFDPAQTTVVVDPPRKGCSTEFLEQLIAFRPARIVYVSCNPATQIRDLNPLRDAGFKLAKVKPFDLFPHTRHLESVMTLVAGAPPAATD